MQPLCKLNRRHSLSRHIYHRISTRLKTTESRYAIQVENPYSGNIHCEIETTNYEDFASSTLDNCVKMQQVFWEDTGKTIGLIERQNICLNFIDEFEKNTEIISREISSMMGKPLQQSRNEIITMRHRAETMVDMATQFLSDQPVP
eukprot:410573_1